MKYIETEAIDKMIYEIDMIVDGILSKTGAFSTYLTPFTESLVKVIPQIVLSYTDSKMAAYVDDMSAWNDQFKRVMEAISGKDKFKIIDILYFELRENLIEYKRISAQQGLEG